MRGWVKAHPTCPLLAPWAPASLLPALPSDCCHPQPSVGAWVGEGQGHTSQCLGARQGDWQLPQSWAGAAMAHVEGHFVGASFPPVQVPRASQVEDTIPCRLPFWGGLQRWACGKGPILLPWTPCPTCLSPPWLSASQVLSLSILAPDNCLQGQWHAHEPSSVTVGDAS